MNPYFNSLNGFAGGFIAFWPAIGAIIPAIRRRIRHNLPVAAGTASMR